MTPKVSPLSSKATLTALFALVALALLFFVTWGEYDRYLAGHDRLAAVETRKTALLETQRKLEAIRAEVTTPAIRADLVRYAGSFREDELYDSILEGGRDVSIGSISLAKGSQLPNGLSFATVSVGIEVPDIPALNRYLDYLTSPDSTRRYVIKSLSVPYTPAMTGPFGVGLSLGLYYYE